MDTFFKGPFVTSVFARCIRGEDFAFFSQQLFCRAVALNRPVFLLPSRMRFLSARGLGDLRRRSRSRFAMREVRSSCSRLINAASNRSRASWRLRACERESCTVTAMPVGRCRSVTAVETLFTFCPPGPPERAKVSSKSDSRNSFIWVGTARCAVRSVFVRRKTFAFSFAQAPDAAAPRPYLTMAGSSRARNASRATSRPARSKTRPRVRHTSLLSNFPFHRRHRGRDSKFTSLNVTASPSSRTTGSSSSITREPPNAPAETPIFRPPCECIPSDTYRARVSAIRDNRDCIPASR